MRPASSFPRFGATGCIVLPIALFIGTMIATAGIALHPPVAAIASPLICPGEMVYESHSGTYRPGETIVTRTIYCVTGAEAGKGGSREEITLKAAGVSFLLYSAIAFILLRLIAVPLIRRGGSRILERTGVRPSAASGRPAGAWRSRRPHFRGGGARRRDGEDARGGRRSARDRRCRRRRGAARASGAASRSGADRCGRI